MSCHGNKNNARSRRHVLVMRSTVAAAVCLASACGLFDSRELERVTVPSCVAGRARAPEFFAYRNEGKEWVAMATQPSVATFSFDATPRVVIAFGDTSERPFNDMYVVRTTVAELRSVVCPSTAPGPTGTREISVTGLAEGATAWIAAGEWSGSTGFGLTAFSVWPRRDTFDIVALRRSTSASAPHAFIVRRQLRLSDVAPIAPLDFSAGEAALGESVTVAIEPPGPGEMRRIDVDLVTARGTALALHEVFLDSSAVPSITVPVPAPGQRASGDLLRASVTYVQGGRSVRGWFAPGEPVVLSPWPRPEPLAATTEWVTRRDGSSGKTSTGSIPASDSRVGMVRAVYGLSTSSPSPHMEWRMEAITTRGYCAGCSAWELGVPDLTRFGAVHLPSAWQGGGTVVVANESLAEYFGGVEARAGRVVYAASR